MSDVLERVDKVFKVAFDNNDLSITKETLVKEVNGLDSFQYVKILTMLQDEFHIEFEFDEIISIENVGDMIKIIESKL